MDKDNKYYSVGWHRFVIILKSFLIFALCLCIAPILIKLLMQMFLKLKFLALKDDYVINVLSSFVGSFAGVCIGFIFEATYIHQWKTLDKYQSLVCVINEELDVLIKKMFGKTIPNFKIIPQLDDEQYKVIYNNIKNGLGIESIRNVCCSVESDSIFYNIPRYIVFQNWMRKKQKKGQISVTLHKVESYIEEFNERIDNSSDNYTALKVYIKGMVENIFILKQLISRK
ncbi:MAG: hypothetical protein J1F66_00490 [Clostridiales bacterium]|nr:hypothetical protein [Clostridiales bacterium]